LPEAERRRVILDAATDVVAAHGAEAASISEIAGRAGITRPIVYSHFGDLRGLLEAMLERESARALSQLAAILPSGDGAAERGDALVVALRGYLEAVRAEPVTWRLVLMPPEGAPERLRERIAEGRAAVVAVLAEVVGSGLAGGRPSPDPVLTARTISAMADEAARLTLTEPGEYPVERLVEHARWLVGELAG